MSRRAFESIRSAATHRPVIARRPLMLALACSGAVLLACSAPKPAVEAQIDAGDPNSPGTGCRRDNDCSNGLKPVCNLQSGVCEAKACSSDSACGTQVCRDGACIDPPLLTSISRCQVVPDFAVFRKGQARTFSVLAFDLNNTPVVLREGAQWTAPTGSPLMASGQGLVISATAQTATSTAVSALRATFGEKSCEAKALVFSDVVKAEKLQVVVVDENTHRPIAAAAVVASDATGAVVPSSAVPLTDANGLVEIDIGTLSPVTVSVYKNEYDYVTVADYNAATGSRLLLLALRRNAFDTRGGFKGTFNNIAPSSNAKIGLSGLSLSGSIADVSASALLGLSVPTDIRIVPLINQKGVPVPQGVFLGFGSDAVKSEISAQGVAGVCHLPSGQADEARIAAGSCGSGAAWGFAGDVPTRELPLTTLLGGAQASSSELLASFIPLFKRFRSSLVREVEFSMTPIVGNPSVVDTQSHTVSNLEYQQTPLSFVFAVKSPELPTLGSVVADRVLLLGGVKTPAQGFVPLGIGAGVNSAMPIDRQVDKAEELVGPGLVQLRMAPAHHGTEGDPLRLTLSAFGGSTVGSAGTTVASMAAKFAGNTLPNEPTGAVPVDLSARAFLPFPAAQYAFVAGGTAAQPARTLSLKASVGSGATVLRTQFVDASGRRWVIWHSGVDGKTALPKPAAGFADRTFALADPTGERSSLSIQSLRMTADEEPQSTGLSFNQLVEMNDTNLESLSDLVIETAQVDYSRPRIAFAVPASAGAVVAKKGTLKLSVSSFRVAEGGTGDGVLRLSFADASGGVPGCPTVFLSTESSAQAGTFESTLPEGCAGANLQLTAQLFSSDQTTPILPPVIRQTTITVQ